MCKLVLEFLIWFLLSTCLFLCQYQAAFITVALIVLDVRDDDASRTFILKDCFGYPGFFCFSIWIWIFFFQVLQGIVLGFWRGIALNLYIAFGKIAIFTLLSLLSQKHGRSFSFLVSYLISFFKDLKFFVWGTQWSRFDGTGVDWCFFSGSTKGQEERWQKMKQESRPDM